MYGDHTDVYYGADLNFEVDFGVNGAIVRLLPSGILFYSDNGSFSSIIYILLDTHHMPLIVKVMYY